MHTIRHKIRGLILMTAILAGLVGVSPAFEGRLVDADGSPVAGGIVKIIGEDGSGEQVPTDGTGKFACELVAADSYAIRATTAMGDAYAGLSLPAGAMTGEVVVVLQSAPAKIASPSVSKPANPSLSAGAYTLGGTIYGGSSPLENVTVVLVDTSSGSELGSIVTDVSGQYSFSVDDGTYRLLIQPPGASGFLDSVVNDIVIDGGNITQNVVLLAGAITLSGVVYGPDETTPASRILVKLYEQATDTFVGESLTDTSGEYSISVSAGLFMIEIEGDKSNDHEFGVAPVTIDMPDNFELLPLVRDLNLAENTELDLVLPFRYLSGRVLDPEGQPVAGAEFRDFHHYHINEGGNYTTYVYNNAEFYTTDEQGNFSLIMFSVVYQTVTIEPPVGSELKTETITDFDATEDRTLDFTLERGIKLSGVVRGPDGTPANMLRMRTNTGNIFYYTDIIDEDGEYAFYLDAGNYLITVEGASWFDDWELSTVALPDHFSFYYGGNFDLTTDTLINIDLPLITVSGRVTNASGEPVAGANIQMITNNQINGMYQFIYCRTNSGLETDDNGEYEAILIPGVEYRVAIIPPEGSGLPSTFHDNELFTEDTVRDYALDSAIRLSGIAKSREGVPASNIYIYIFHDVYSPSNFAHILTDETGEFEFIVSPGEYRFNVGGFFLGEDPGPTVPLPRSFNVENFFPPTVYTEDTELPVELPLVELSGQTTDRNGVPIPSVSVAIDHTYYEEPEHHRRTMLSGPYFFSDSNGWYSMPVLIGTHSPNIIPPVDSGFGSTVIADLQFTDDIRQNVILDIPDTRAPVILSGPYVSAITNTTAMLEWRTNEPADSVAHYGTGGSTDQTLTDTEFKTEHVMQLTELTPGTAYSLYVASTDPTGNGPTESETIEFITPTPPDEEPPFITEGPIVIAITHTSALVRWWTDEPATTVVDYGTSTSLDETVDRAGYRTAHEVELTGLTALTEYYVQVSSTDKIGNGPTQSAIISFISLEAPDAEAPIIVEGPLAVDISDTEATIVWTTDEPADSGVSYNDGTHYGIARDEAFVTDHVVRLMSLTPATVYHCTVSSTDPLGNGPTLSKKFIFKTLPAADQTAPIIVGGPAVLTTTHKIALIRWTTDERSDSVIEYGTDPDNLDQRVIKTALVRRHTIPLTHLNPNTVYYFRVLSTDAAGNGPTASESMDFKTRGTFHGGLPLFRRIPFLVGKSDRTLTVKWEIDRPCDAVIEYGPTAELGKRHSKSDKKLKNQVTLTGLDAGIRYYLRVRVTDMFGNSSVWESETENEPQNQSFRLAEAGDYLTDVDPDLKLPVIVEGPEVVSLSDSEALIRWVTDEIADSRVEYGLQGQALDRFEGEIARTLEHLVLLTNLEAATGYSFTVTSVDVAGNASVDHSPIDFTTTAAADAVPPSAVNDAVVSDTSRNGTQIQVQSDEYCTVEIRFGTDPESLDYTAGDDTLATDHTVNLTELDNDTVYYFVIVLTDAAGNETSSEVESLLTGDPPNLASTTLLFD